jgi:aurora kinase, other
MEPLAELSQNFTSCNISQGSKYTPRYPHTLLEERKLHHFTLNDFDVAKKVLGEGKFGKVYRVRERKTRKQAVLKVISKKTVLYENVKHQLQREVEVHSRLSHPNIVQFYAYFHDEENVYILLEYCNGNSLYHYLQNLSSKKLNESDASKFISQLCSALQYCHSKNILHRDIKPENILLHYDANGNEMIKLADFGWSVVERKDTSRKTLCGTLEYLPPEVCKNEVYHSNFDMWTVGILLYEMLVGHSPFFISNFSRDNPINSQEAIVGRIQSCEFEVPSTLSREAIDLITKLLKLEPTERFTAEQVLAHPWIIKYKHN